MATNLMDQEMRYGISALSTEHHKVAEPDELMVRTQDGQMFYKREDGQIVTAVKDYDRKSLVSDLISTGINIDLSKNQYIAYHTVDIAGVNTLIDAEVQPLDLDEVKFYLPETENCLCIRVRGNDVTNATVAYMKALTEDTEEDDVIITLSTGDEIKCQFNKLTLVRLSSAGIVTIKSIQFPAIAKAYESLDVGQKNTIGAMNMNNDKYEAAVIDVVELITDASKIPLYKNNGVVALKMLFPVEAIIDENLSLSGGGIVISDTQPDHPCIWAKTNPSYKKP